MSIIIDPVIIDSIQVVARDSINIHVHHYINPATSESSILLDLAKNVVTIIIALGAGMIALYQVKSNVISSARIQWITDLRECTSNIYGVAISTHSNIKNAMDKKAGTEINLQYYEKYNATQHELNILVNKIKMLLNPDENEHLKLESIIDEIDKMLDKDKIDKITSLELENKLKEIIPISKAIFKKEWKKSKKLLKI